MGARVSAGFASSRAVTAAPTAARTGAPIEAGGAGLERPKKLMPTPMNPAAAGWQGPPPPASHQKMP